MKIIHSLCLCVKIDGDLDHNNFTKYKDDTINWKMKNKKKVNPLNTHHIIGHTQPASLIQHLSHTRLTQKPIQATSAKVKVLVHSTIKTSKMSSHKK